VKYDADPDIHPAGYHRLNLLVPLPLLLESARLISCTVPCDEN